MSEPQWKKGGTTAGKYPEKAFAAVLKAIYPGLVGKEDISALKLDFEGDLQLAIFGIDQLKDDGTIEGFKDLGKFLDSLTTQKIEYFWGVEENEIMGFKTEPNLIGCKLFMKPEERKGDPGSKWEGQVFRNWVVEKYEKVTASPGATVTETAKSRPASELTDAPLALKPLLFDIPAKSRPASELTDALPDVLKVEKTIKELYEFFNKKYKISEIKSALAALESDGMVEKQGDKYKAV